MSFPVPDEDYGDGEYVAIAIDSNWRKVLLGAVGLLTAFGQWDNPPSDITAQVNGLLADIMTDYVPAVNLSTYAQHWHVNSKVIAGNAIAFLQSSSGIMNGVWRQTPGALNDHFRFELALPAGTFDLKLIYTRASNGGIVSLDVDGIDQTLSLDTYGTTAYNLEAAQQLEIDEAGVHVFDFTVESKNASSSGYYFNLLCVLISPH